MTVKIMVDTAMLRCLIEDHRSSGNATSDEEQAMKDLDESILRAEGAR